MQMETSGKTATSDRDALFEVLSHRRRRRVLGVLAATDEPPTLTSLAEELARRSETGAATADRVERIRLTLYHSHVPKLADRGLVAVDPVDETVRLTGGVPESVLLEAESVTGIE